MNETFKYHELVKNNLIRRLKPALQKGLVYIRPNDQKLAMRTGVPWYTPWIFGGIKTDADMNCVLYHDLILPYYDFIPTRCQGCWKVVARPNTVEELFKVSDLQQESDRQSKAGIEVRESVSALYGAYWYNDSLESGMECKKYVERMMDDVGPDIDVFLKRGCTEFEHKFGNSMNWAVSDENRKTEDLINENITIEGAEDYSQSWYVIEETKLQWVEWAFQHGDKTYAKFTGGDPLYPPYVKYFSREEAEGADGV